MKADTRPSVSVWLFFTHLIGPALELPKASGSPAFQSTIPIQASGSDTLGPGSAGSIHWSKSYSRSKSQGVSCMSKKMLSDMIGCSNEAKRRAVCEAAGSQRAAVQLVA
jgi:hypothetical protein